ncbi:hypothetical protein [Actinomadura sp. 6N118]|uniref:hypothetical protein n=1 Tax=Actinomadura sp. 6N118 TaxID=3375151 RepID=UPI00379F3205
MPNGLDDLEAQAAARKARRQRQAPPPRNPRARRSQGEPTGDEQLQAAQAQDEQAQVPDPREAAEGPTDSDPPFETPEATAPSHADAGTEQPGVHVAAEMTPATIAEMIPRPHQPLSSSQDLIEAERDELERCERVLAIADTWFWVKGRVLQTIRDGDLYRETHTRFDDYCQEHWEMTARRANQLIEAWPLAEDLMLILGTIVPKINLNEGQVRRLLPYYKAHGKDAAVFVYETIAHSNTRVTAAILDAALAVLPPDRFDRDEVARLLRDFLAAGSRVLSAPATPDNSQSDFLTTEIRKIETLGRRIVKNAKDDPDAARRLADELDQLANQIRAELT